MGVKIPRNSLVERLFNVEVSSSNHSVSAGYDLGYLGHKGGGNLGCRIRPYSGLREKIGNESRKCYGLRRYLIVHHLLRVVAFLEH